MIREPQPDLFNAMRNRISIILIKLNRYGKMSPDKDKPGHIAFWVAVEKDFDILSALVKEKRVGPRHKGLSFAQRLFVWLLSIIIVMLLSLGYQVLDNHKDINKLNTIELKNK